ncbi:leucine aminopeptidase, putative [Babesia bigemina]|uniref:Leucine aminopeptidase, putative n=1 Tax=Babesia bigemina TaxID=5866 RepID=A0A061D439_BABBI|nr:leucine aminopeptidase, putative [Babesia bigemina]CDR95323.1 leucine aminopeptidase, putative [Babesia bigemina]|eukprot:XP_012767509.1 leucine aminopeptidase, putative [Babesia bigemina]
MSTVDVINKFPSTESPAAGATVGIFHTDGVPSAAAIDGLAGPVEVFHLVFASGSPPGDRSAGFSIHKYDRFPNAFVTSEAGIRGVAGAAFSAKMGEVVEFFTTRENGSLLAEALVGCGKFADFKVSDAYNVARAVAQTSAHRKCKNVILVLGSLDIGFVEALVTGFLNHISVDRRFRKDTTTEYHLNGVYIATLAIEDVESLALRCKVLAKAMHMSRELVTAPANYANTLSVSSFLKDKLTALGLEVKLLYEEDCRALGMGAYCAVAQGSRYPPVFVHATYRGEGPTKATIALVGKGIMFDSGGLNIKSASSEIELMKFDMGGMSAVFAAAEAIGTLKPSGVVVHFISATCENMAGSKAYRPGDIITASNGKTIEVINTDAEGRLTLADALVYAEKLGVDYIIDLATLTGGCIVALGFKYGGYFANNEELNSSFVKALEKSGELAWRMPLAKEYADCLESKVADLNNCSYKVKASTISAALFLKEFVERTKWIHWDIAGTAFDRNTGRGTGYGVRTLVNLVLDLAEH